MEQREWRVAVCDDEELFLGVLCEKIEKYFREIGKACRIFSYTSSEKMLADSLAAELYFLDIDMPGLSGLVVAERLASRNGDAVIIFVSSHEEMVFEAIHYAPFRFIRKSHLEKELPEALASWEKVCQAQEQSCMTLEIKTRDGIVARRAEEILYLESNRHYLRVVCGDSVYETRGKISDYETILNEPEWVRVNVGYLVNCRYIARLKTGILTLKNGEEITISRGKNEKVKAAYMAYVREHMAGV